MDDNHSLNRPRSQSQEHTDCLQKRLQNLSERLAATYVAVGRPVPDPVALATMTADLASRYSDEQIKAALARVRSECRFVSLADIIERIPGAGADDGRPGAETGWAMCPKDEASSCVWTAEMAQAFAAARPLLRDGDVVSARMAFKEAYSRAVDVARREGVPVRWTVSLGHDKEDRVRALTDGVMKKQITREAALDLLGPEQQHEFLMALPGEQPRGLLQGEVTRMLPGLAGVLQQMRMDGDVPASCDPGPVKPKGRVMSDDELEQRRVLLRRQGEMLLKKDVVP